MKQKNKTNTNIHEITSLARSKSDITISISSDL